MGQKTEVFAFGLRLMRKAIRSSPRRPDGAAQPACKAAAAGVGVERRDFVLALEDAGFNSATV